MWIKTWKESSTTIRGDLVCLFASDLLVLSCRFVKVSLARLETLTNERSELFCVQA